MTDFKQATPATLTAFLGYYFWSVSRVFSEMLDPEKVSLPLNAVLLYAVIGAVIGAAFVGGTLNFAAKVAGGKPQFQRITFCLGSAAFYPSMLAAASTGALLFILDSAVGQWWVGNYLLNVWILLSVIAGFWMVYNVLLATRLVYEFTWARAVTTWFLLYATLIGTVFAISFALWS
tara:strand:+ start:904 stop:1431 length:528 start_codon:yes stop_codon:yes gene_type:complete